METAKITLPAIPRIIDKPVSKIADTQVNFGQFLTNALNKVNNQLSQADQISLDYAAGKNVELHNVIIANEQASMALYLTVQVRNKVIEAYQEISRMQV